jgi:hypothetical protein
MCDLYVLCGSKKQKKMKHHIEKIIVDMYLNKQDGAYELQQKVSHLFHAKIENITDKILSEYSDKHTTIYINKLELELGDIRASHFKLDFVQQYEIQLRKAIKSAISKIKSQPTSRREKRQTTENANPKNAELSYLQDFSSQSADENILEILVFFLSFGRLPANASKGFNINAALQHSLNQQKNLTIERLKPLLKQQEIVHRLVYSFTQTTANSLLSALLPNRFSSISVAIQNATTIFETNQFGTNQQKIHKRLLLLSFELIRQTFIQKNTLEIDLNELNTSFLKVLPKQWQTTEIPIYDTTFKTQKTRKIDIDKLIELSYENLVKILQKAVNRQFIIESSTSTQREILLKTLAQNHLQTIQKMVNSFSQSTVRANENEIFKNSKDENKEKINNIVWSAIFEQFSKHNTPNTIQTKQLERAIQNSMKQLGSNESENDRASLNRNKSENDRANLNRNESENDRANLNRNKSENDRANLNRNESENDRANLNRNESENDRANLNRNESENDRANLNRNESENDRANLNRNESENDRANLNRNESENDRANLNRNESENDRANLNRNESENDRANLGNNANKKVISLVKRAEDILEIYLTEGYFIQTITLNDLIEKMLGTNAVQLRFLLNRITKTQAAQNRLTENLSLGNLIKVLKILTPNLQFISIVQDLISEKQQIILLKNTIQQQLKYGKIESILVLDAFLKSVSLENLPLDFLDNLIQKSATETTQFFIPPYFAIEKVINPIVESEVPEIFEATRFLDYLLQYFNQNTTQNTTQSKSEIWWAKTISSDDLNQNFQSVISIYPNEIKDIFNNLSKQKNAATALIELLNETNLTVLMNLIEPNIFGFISTLILTTEKYTSINKAWKITLEAYFNTPKPFNTNIFTQQILLLLAQELKQPYQETIKEILIYSEAQIKNNQHRYHALKHIIQQDIRMKNTPQLLIENIENEAIANDNINVNQNQLNKNLATENIDNQAIELNQETKNNSNQNKKNLVNENEKFDTTETSLPIEIIGYFLKYGTLPVAQKDLTEAGFIIIIKNQGIENLNLLKITLQKLSKNTVSNNQLKQISEPIFIELIKVLQPKVGLSILDIYADLKMVIDAGLLKTSMVEVIANLRVFNQKSNFEKHFIHQVLTILTHNFSYTYTSAVTAILNELEGKNTKSNVVKLLRIIKIRLTEQEQMDTIENKPVPVVERTITPLKDTAIYIENSGIVILAVYLPHLFNMFKLIENKKFKDMESACRAAYLIHFIATGRVEPMEHELVLSKIICNIPLGQPINAVITLTEEEQEACKQLMKAAIGRWEKVKSSSVEGFRNSFIAREGKLLKISKGWSLAVEQKPFDLLLKTLPWGIAMVRFSWMDEPIYVDWAY